MLELLGSRRLHFLLTALLRIAVSASPVSGKRLAAMLHCPRRYLEPDLQALVSAGFLASRRGAGGGYLLAISPHRISMFDIMHCIVSDAALIPDADACRLQREVVYPLILGAQQDCHQALARISLAEYIEKAEQEGILNQSASVPDFII